jgi:hypothetical protein
LFSLDVSRPIVKQAVVLCGVICSIAVSSMCAQPAAEPRVRALEAKAICPALAAFQAAAPKADLRHYAVLVGKEGRNIDVVFLPDPGPGEEFMVGGATKYGAEVHYIISPRTFKVLRMHYAR